MYNDLTAIILSGGKSSRMGVDKAFLKINGITLIERIYSVLSNIFNKTIIISNKPEDYNFLKTDVFNDIIQNAGPIAGIHSGLINSHTDRNFVISCDMPLITDDIIKYIIEYDSEKQIKVCKADKHIQPLAGVYNKSVIFEIEKIINESNNLITHNSTEGKKNYNLKTLIKNCDSEIIEIEEVFGGNFFLNLNTPEDYQNLLKKYK